MIPEWGIDRPTLQSQRRSANRCTQCGKHAPTKGRETCDGCHARSYLSLKSVRHRQLEEHRQRVAAVNERRNRTRREIVIDGTTFLVMNDN